MPRVMAPTLEACVTFVCRGDIGILAVAQKSVFPVVAAVMS